MKKKVTDKDARETSKLFKSWNRQELVEHAEFCLKDENRAFLIETVVTHASEKDLLELAQKLVGKLKRVQIFQLLRETGYIESEDD